MSLQRDSVPQEPLGKRPELWSGMYEQSSEPEHADLPGAHMLRRCSSLVGRGSGQIRAQALLGAQQRHGNRAVQRSTPMPQPQGLEELVRTLRDRETGGALGMLGGIVGDVATSAGGLVGTLGEAFGGLADADSGAAWEGASAEASASAAEGGADYGHNSASTAREAERSAATKPSEVPLDRATLERMEESGMW